MLEDLTTEGINPASERLDGLSAIEIVRLINQEDAKIAAAVAAEADLIAKAVDIVAGAIGTGGRLVYLGAGTSGRLGVLDASECPPTFNSPRGQVVGVIAGGYDALTNSIEGAEDYPEFGVRDLQEIEFSSSDVLVGIATSGRTPYVIGGLEYARRLGAPAIGLSCNRQSELHKVADFCITPVVGPEVLSGSTRMKAGTATKMVLNMLTTGAMVRLGKTFGNLMVDLRATNSKLESRARRIVRMLTKISDEEAGSLLDACRGEVKTAVLSHQASVTADEARRRLLLHDGHLRKALSPPQMIQSQKDVSSGS